MEMNAFNKRSSFLAAIVTVVIIITQGQCQLDLQSFEANQLSESLATASPLLKSVAMVGSCSAAGRRFASRYGRGGGGVLLSLHLVLPEVIRL